MRIAILGAKRTGKTHLAQELAPLLRSTFAQVAVIPDAWQALRDRIGDDPLNEELWVAANAQMANVLQLPEDTLVLCDTPPLLAAVYSDVMTGDPGLYHQAIDQHRAFALTLLTGMDLPSDVAGTPSPDTGIRSQIDRRLRQVLVENRIEFSIVYGSGPTRTQSARQSILRVHGNVPDTPRSNWQWTCEKCSDAACEHQLFSALISGA